MSTITLGAVLTASPPRNPLGTRTPTPSVYIIPPEEEQEDNPPWCCYDSEAPHAEPANTAEFVTELEADPNWNADDESPVFRRSDSRSLDEIAVMPRRGSRQSVYFGDRAAPDAVVTGSGTMDVDVDDIVVEVVRVGRRREVEAADEEAAVKGDTWKKTRGLTLRARAAQALKSMRGAGSSSVKTAGTSSTKNRPEHARRHVKDVFRPVENAQMESSGPGPVRRMSVTKLARRSSKATRRGAPEASEMQASDSLPTHSTRTITRRLSQLFVSASRSSMDSVRGGDTAARPQSPLASDVMASPSCTSSMVDVAMDVASEPAAQDANVDSRPLSPGLQPKRGPSIRRLSMRNIRGLFTRDAPSSSTIPISDSQSTTTLAQAGSSATVSASAAPEEILVQSPSSSSYSSYMGIGSPTSPILMSRDSRTVSDASTEPPETPKDPVARFSFSRDRMGRSSVSTSRLSEDAAGGKVDMDENLEMRLDSLQFDSIHFDPDEFQVSF
ncbi:hypothetical protein PUNSTDRAFT_121035 [Punctularia strigosozonata HHB-11173 SS5]|uniref:uncharacterized protein n=1 Tax=Punctularia strigosozonata (strain HHB-11173) TaxID=741275 RepID=UPI0004416A5B|nr:uncharacterized protein PUNSTDRAFT_121035 [Punctularia strigosozonata HHB-11173 SS5]EIN07793.1 hypothetical protein PUNSTDRAFT_121035 [Punctularia strigosozonata HHB-11173 SS5]